MASNDNSNLVQELEESFKKCLTALTEEDDLYSRDPEDVNKDIDEKISQVLGQIFFATTYCLHEYFPVHGRGAAAGDFLPAEEVHDLQPQARDDPEGGHGRAEGRAGGSCFTFESVHLCIVQGRKDELIRKHYEKLGKWKEMLADAQVAPQHPSTARASRSHIIQSYISPCIHILSYLILSYLILSHLLCPVLAPAPLRAQL